MISPAQTHRVVTENPAAIWRQPLGKIGAGCPFMSQKTCMSVCHANGQLASDTNNPTQIRTVDDDFIFSLFSFPGVRIFARPALGEIKF